MLEFKIDSDNPVLLRTAIAYDFFFENYGVFLNAAVAAGKKNTELVDEIEKVLSLSFSMADMFISKVYEQKEEANDNV
jgi:hypothetical protein